MLFQEIIPKYQDEIKMIIYKHKTEIILGLVPLLFRTSVIIPFS